jgi:hypothetical protein
LDEWLYDSADEELAYQELAHRDKVRAEYVARWPMRPRTESEIASGKTFEAEWLAKSIREQPRPHKP